MKKNEATWDRILRTAAGIGLISWGIMGGPVWAYIGLVPLATGLLGNCPVYSLFGFSTCSLKTKDPH
jgi:hypothetical protein